MKDDERTTDCAETERRTTSDARQRIRVAILGGGVAGLSAAHELAKHSGFQVEVFERSGEIGGKAKSQDVAGQLGATMGGRALLGEHGFRLFPHFYRHITQTLREIPFHDDHAEKLGRLPALDGSVWGNLRGSTEGGYANGSLHTVQRPFPPTTLDVVRAVRDLLGNGSVATESDVAVYAWHILKFLTACQERRDEEYDRITWAEFVGVGKGYYSSAFEQFVRAAPRNLSAMWPDKCSARSCGGTLVQMLVDFSGERGTQMDAVLTGPTTETWLEPWSRHLEGRGVRFRYNAHLTGFEFDGRRITGVVIQDARDVDSPYERCTGYDYYIAALPLEVMQSVLSGKGVHADVAEPARAMIEFDESLRLLTQIEEGTAPMVGIQFFLREDVSLCHGHVLYPDSPWALTSVSQGQFWDKQFIPASTGKTSFNQHVWDRFGIKGVAGVLSVIISDWDTTSPRLGRPARECTEEELLVEVWMQLTEALSSGERVLKDEHLWGWDPESEDEPPTSPKRREVWLKRVLRRAAHVDDDVLWDEHVEEETGETRRWVMGFETPLFVHPRGSQRLRPDAQLRIPNLLLASDYVRTYTDLATMEAANEAARRAVLAILRRETVASPQVYPMLWPLLEGPWFEAAKAIDRLLYSNGQPHLMDAPRILSAIFGSAFDGAFKAGLEVFGLRGRMSPPAELARRVISRAGIRAQAQQQERIGPAGAVTIATVERMSSMLGNLGAALGSLGEFVNPR